MEFVRPQHHTRVGGASHLLQDISCRVDELTKAMQDNTVISPTQFSWICPEELCDRIQSSNPIVIDCRDDSESLGGSIANSIRLRIAHYHDPAAVGLFTEWRRGQYLVFYCNRSQSRAPAAAHTMVRCIESRSSGCVPRDDEGRIPRVAVLHGGMCGFLTYLFTDPSYSSGPFPAADSARRHSAPLLLKDFDAEMWVVSPPGAAAALAHVSEVPQALEDCRAARALREGDEAETASELAFLLASGCSVSPSAAASMPYIS